MSKFKTSPEVMREFLEDKRDSAIICEYAYDSAVLTEILDRLEKLEAVAEAARKWVDPYWHIPPNHLKQDLLDALAALGGVKK